MCSTDRVVFTRRVRAAQKVILRLESSGRKLCCLRAQTSLCVGPCWMQFECLSEEIAAAPVPMEVTPPQRMASACVGVLATSLVATPMGE